MSARLVLHLITTLVLFAIGWWMYLRVDVNVENAFSSVDVAKFWFTSLIYIFFSWIFYWIVHKYKLKAWVIAQVFAIIIAAVSIVVLLYISREHQQQIEHEVMLEEQGESLSEKEESVDSSEANLIDKPTTLNLSEELEGSEITNPDSGEITE